MVSGKGDANQSLVRAKKLEAEYDWISAAGLYNAALSSLGGANLAAAARISESCAFALFKAAFQVDRREEFTSRMEESAKAYRESLGAYGRISRPESPFSAKRCEAMLAYADYWLASDQLSRRKLIGEAWSHSDQALRGFEEIDNRTELSITYHQLALTAALSYSYEESYQDRERIIKSAADHGERAMTSVDAREDPHLLAAVLAISAAFVSAFGDGFHDMHSRGPFNKKATDYWTKALSLSEEQVFSELPHSHLLSVAPSYSSFPEIVSLLLKALVTCRKTGDKFLVGCVLEWLAGSIAWQAWGAEDRDTRQSLCEESLKHAHEAKDMFSVISHLSPIPWGDLLVEVPEAGYYANMALFETDPSMKRDFAEKGLDLVREALRRAEYSGFPEVIMIAHDVTDHVLIALAETETDPEKKASLLNEAISHRTESLRLLERYSPFSDWGRGWWQGPLGTAKLELAELTKDPRLKEDLLKAGIRCEKTAVELSTKALTPADESDPIMVNLIGLWRHKLIEGLHRLYELTRRAEYLRDAIEALDAAAESYRKVKMVSRIAECHWKSALFLDTLSEHSAAAEKFRLASDDFKMAAEKFPGLKELYNDHSNYMLAWQAIENARHHHSRQEYGLSRDSFKVGAERHQSTIEWNHLSINYFAWAAFESAEDLSLQEKSKESIEAFREAAKLFDESGKKLSERPTETDVMDERQMMQRLIDSAGQMQTLCQARIALEEARLLDKGGNLDSASERYSLVAEMFSKMKDGLDPEGNRQDTDLMIVMSNAWKAMAKAEAESSPELYEEAAKLFEEAKNLSPGEKAKSLAMGHSRLSVALAAGARYADTGDAALHAVAVKSLESAAKYYLKADQQTAVEYVKGSKLLFDGYDYMNRASSEGDEQKKTKLYSMAEKVLQASASSFEKAGQHGRKEQVLKLLAKVKEDRELAVSLVEVFLAPDMVSTTMAFSSPVPTHETAAGLDRFEHADVRATLIAHPTQLHVGQEFSLEIELVNAGRGSAQLAKVEEIVPEGFAIVEKPEKCRMEGNGIDMRGRRLDALKTESLQLVLKPTTRGSFKLKPRVTYLDESGTHKSCAPAPIDVTVKEMGISGWIRGT